MDFGLRVRTVLEMKGLKQSDLCEMAGIKSGLLSQYMTNPDRDPKLSTACKIALALDVSLDYLGGLIDEPKPVGYADESLRISLEERGLLDAYRASNAQGRATIMGVAQIQQGVEGTSDAGHGAASRRRA